MGSWVSFYYVVFLIFLYLVLLLKTTSSKLYLNRKALIVCYSTSYQNHHFTVTKIRGQKVLHFVRFCQILFPQNLYRALDWEIYFANFRFFKLAKAHPNPRT